MTTTRNDRMTVLLGPDELRRDLESDARTGLSSSPKWLPPKYFYDDRGSELFEDITRLPEYYPTRAEAGLLQRYAVEIAEAAAAKVLVELGSGSSAKTRLLLDALAEAGTLAAYVPVDVSMGALREAMAGLTRDYPDLELHGVVADFEHHLNELPAPGGRLVVFLGGTLGNFPPEARATFLAAIAAALQPGETVLLGVDLVKDAGRLVAAYDDAAGVTAEFNRNVLRVLNRELDGNLDVDAFEHVAVWDAVNEWIEMRLRATRAMTARLAELDLQLTLTAGEEIRTEISAKFRRERIGQELATAGLHPEGWWTDGDFALVLARR